MQTYLYVGKLWDSCNLIIDSFPPIFTPNLTVGALVHPGRMSSNCVAKTHQSRKVSSNLMNNLRMEWRPI